MKTKIKTRAIKAGLSFAMLSFFAPSVMFASGVVEIPNNATDEEIAAAKVKLETPTLADSAYKLTEGDTGSFVITKYLQNETTGALTEVDYNMLVQSIGDETGDDIKYFKWLEDETTGKLTLSDDGSSTNNDFYIQYTSSDYVGKNRAIWWNTTSAGYHYVAANFIGNYHSETGGAIKSTTYGTVEYIRGDFIANYVKGTYSSMQGGAIWNDSSSTINEITGNFIGNYAEGSSTSASGGAIYNKGTITSLTGDFIGNYVKGASTTVSGGAIYNGGTITSLTGDFIGNYIYSSSKASGGAIYNSSGTIGSLTGDFIGNSAYSENSTVYGGAIWNGATITSLTGDFTGNSAYSESSTVSGGAIYNSNGLISSIEGDFIANYASSKTSSAYGGAIYDATYTANKSIGSIEGDFIGNYASSSSDAKGGAIYSAFSNSSITLTASEGNNYSYLNNYAEVSGVKSDENGGFLYMQKGTVTFETEKDSSITIGNGTAGYDSIASNIDYATDTTINKTGEGTLTVNSSMQYYTGALNVEAGTMNVNNILGASSISIGTTDTSATLALKISGDYTLASDTIETISFNNTDSVLKLIASSTSTTSQEYALSANADFSIDDLYSSQIITYGGTLSGNTFTTTAATTYADKSIEVSSYDNIVINDSVVMSFTSISDSSTVTLNSASDSTSALNTYLSDSGISYNSSSAYTFSVSGLDSDTDSVVLSFIVADSNYSVSDFTIYYMKDGGEWEVATNVSEVSYEEGTLSFIVDGFSTYGYAAVPEPSTYALIFGALALGFVYYRKRK